MDSILLPDLAACGKRAGRLRTLVLCFLAQNLCAGFAFGAFGPLLASNEMRFSISRTASSLAMSVLMLVLGIVAPFAGGLLDKIKVRTGMIAGAALSAAGYAAIAIAPSYSLALIAYGAVGAGISVTGILGPLALIGRSYRQHRAKALSVVNLPIMLFIVPVLVSALLPVVGRTGLFMGIALIFVFLAGLLAFLDDPPLEPGETPAGKGLVRPAGLLRSSSIWLLALGAGIIAGSSAAYYVHVVPFGVERGMTLTESAALVSSYTGAGIAGTLLFGWLADRIGAIRTLVLSAVLQASMWWWLLVATGPAMYFAAALLGTCAVPQNTLLGAANTALFGSRSVRAMGICYALKLPFLFGFAPMVGALREESLAYRAPFMVCAGLLLIAAGVLVWLQVIARKPSEAALRLE